ncbi:MAG: type IX secretion system membrane protein PorP/SprF [Chitinophagales bacterium]|nr:type IX secretion system membrane protein PorP/SprF [Bacteroidota bacterium]MCB9043047.1 type IX secretion system membrane protein PorP/SprF [Chitinophagales bacterium]
MKRLNTPYARFIFPAFIVCLILFQDIKAQQDAQYTQYMFNGLVLNPAYAGSRDALSATAIGRTQWVGQQIEGAPRTASLSVHSPVGKHVGLGLWGQIDEIGPHNKIDVFGSYAYTLNFDGGLRLALGIQAGIQSYNSEYTKVETTVYDPRLSEDFNKILPNFGAGAYLYNTKFYLGLSVPHLLNNEIQPNSTGGADTLNNKLAHQYRHYFLTGGLILALSESIDFRPSFLLKYVPSVAPLSADFNVSFLLKKVLWLGASYRNFDSVDFLVEIQATPQLRIGYAYDYTLSKLQNVNTGSHEVMIGLDIDKGNQKIVTPRYF